jgi:surface protein
MRSLLEFLSTNVKQSIIHADDKTIRDMVKSEIDRLGNDADLNHIDVSAVTNFAGLFAVREDIAGEPKRLGKKYKTINPDISRWNTENATNFDSLFLGCEKFNCDLSEWKTGNVENMSYTFCCCYDFSSDLSDWDVSSCLRMNGMFSIAKSFDCDISSWKVGNVWDMEYMFNEALTFSYDISNWDTRKVTSHKHCFDGCNNANWPRHKRPKFN